MIKKIKSFIDNFKKVKELEEKEVFLQEKEQELNKQKKEIEKVSKEAKQEKEKVVKEKNAIKRKQKEIEETVRYSKMNEDQALYQFLRKHNGRMWTNAEGVRIVVSPEIRFHHYDTFQKLLSAWEKRTRKTFIKWESREDSVIRYSRKIHKRKGA